MVSVALAISIIAVGAWCCTRRQKTKATVVSQGKADEDVVQDFKHGIELDGLDPQRSWSWIRRASGKLSWLAVMQFRLRESAQRHELP